MSQATKTKSNEDSLEVRLMRALGMSEEEIQAAVNAPPTRPEMMSREEILAYQRSGARAVVSPRQRKTPKSP